MGRRAPRELSHAIRALRAGASPPTLLAAVQEQWDAAAGPDVSEQAQPVLERHGVITVFCRSAVWASELTLLSETLRDRINARLGGESQVRAFKFTTTPS